MKNTAILINGHPNSGKSTLVDSLKKKFKNDIEFYTFNYDDNFIKATSECNSNDRQCFREAKRKLLRGIIEGSQKVNLISDLLLTTKEVFHLSSEMRNSSVDVIAIRLYCDQMVREQRDAKRKLKNPNAPDGFNHSLNPDPNIIVYDLELDTSIKGVNDICNDIVTYMKTKNLFL